MSLPVTVEVNEHLGDTIEIIVKYYRGIMVSPVTLFLLPDMEESL